MNAAVTGGTGFVGRHLIVALCEGGHQVTALVRSRKKAESLRDSGARLIEGDLGHDLALSAATRGQDAVFHVAGLTKARDEAEFNEVNRDGTRRLLDAAVRDGRPRFIYVSSLAAVGPSAPGAPRGDDLPPAPVTAYGRSKLAGERIVRGSALPWTILRPPMVYGPGDTELLKVFKLARLGWTPIFGRGTQELSAVYAPDLASALVAAAEAEATVGRTYAPCHPEIFSTRMLAAAVGQATGRKVRIIGLSERSSRALFAVTGTTARLFRRTTILTPDKLNEFFAPAWTADPAPLARDAAWQAEHDLDAGLRATAAWYREQGWI
jgi:nucleoside-diphosphate-sugar epimerase